MPPHGIACTGVDSDGLSTEPPELEPGDVCLCGEIDVVIRAVKSARDSVAIVLG